MKLPTVQLKDLVPTKEHSLLKHTLEFLENIWDEEYDILRQPSLGRETLLATAAKIQSQIMKKLRALEGKPKLNSAKGKSNICLCW